MAIEDTHQYQIRVCPEHCSTVVSVQGIQERAFAFERLRNFQDKQPFFQQ